MKTIRYKLLAIILLIAIVSCKNEKHQDKRLKSVEKIEEYQEDKTVALPISKFVDYPNLLKRVDEIVCNDSIPVINVTINETLVTYKISTPCWDKIGDILIKQKNVLIVHDDSIEKRFTNPWVRKKYPLFKLDSLLKKDISNNGRDSNWSESPAKHILSISVSDNNVSKLQPIFFELGKALERDNLSSDIRIWLTDYVPYFKLPLPPDKK